MRKSYCMKCKKEVSEGTKICECDGRYFAYGESFKLGEKGIICVCGNGKFNRTMHIDCSDRAINNYSCTKCHNLIATESYRSEEDMMYWED